MLHPVPNLETHSILQVGILGVLVSRGTIRVARNDLRVEGTLFVPLVVLIEEMAQIFGIVTN